MNAGKGMKKRSFVNRKNNHEKSSNKIHHRSSDSSSAGPEEEEIMFEKMRKKRSDSEKFEGRRRLLKYEELPDYLKDNEFILDYYVSEWPLKETFFSVFSWHNETLNIWTHLGGFFIFLFLTVLSSIDSTFDIPNFLSVFSRSIQMPLMMMNNASETTVLQAKQDPYGLIFQTINSVRALNNNDDVPNVPRWPWFVFLLGAMGCLICSSISHLFASHSRRLNLFFWRLDYAGISFMIICSFFSPIYYAFFCNPYSRNFYLTSITILGVLVVITLLAPVLSSPQFRSFRATLFLSMSFSGVIPAAHAVILHWGHPAIFVALTYELVMAVFYAIGVVFYVSRVPERWKPGAFDIAGHSHQIFHVFVVAGALAHYGATLVLLQWRMSSPTCNI